MSVLGVVIRVRPEHLDEVKERLMRVPGVDLAPDAGDGRLAATIESTALTPAATAMGDIAQWPRVMNLSLVFEHSDAEPAGPESADFDFRAWRGSVGDFARRQAQASNPSPSPVSTSAAEGAGEAR
jgi:nitrate reductase NapAB chaperone NapD